jgi:K+-transporting ATPase KdpF subunit
MTLALAALSVADVLGLAVAALLCVYLLYALLRGENL